MQLLPLSTKKAFYSLQLAPHRDFNEECAALCATFSPLGFVSVSRALGDACAGLQWHVFAAHHPAADVSSIPSSVDLCCTQLARTKAVAFFRTSC